MPVELHTLAKGDVCVRQGAPHMVVEVSVPVAVRLEQDLPPEGTVWVCNLQTGSVWPASASDQVHPATNVVLSYASARRGELS